MNRTAFLAGAGSMLAALPARAESLERQIAVIAQTMPGTLGVYARTLAQSTPIAAYNAAMRFPTASTIKVLIMATAYAQADAHPRVLDEKIVYHRRQLVDGSDFMSKARDGQSFTVRELIVPMITLSDNTAANLLLEHFGMPAVNAMAARAGMKQTQVERRFMDFGAIAQHRDNLSTPADMGRLLYLIERGAHVPVQTIASPQGCAAMIAVMLRQTDREGIPAALPPGTPVANKTGVLVATRNDVAVIEPYGRDPLILIILTKEITGEQAAYAAIHSVTRAVYTSARAGASGGRQTRQP